MIIQWNLMKHTYTLSIEISPGGLKLVKIKTLQLRYMMMMHGKEIAIYIIANYK